LGGQHGTTKGQSPNPFVKNPRRYCDGSICTSLSTESRSINTVLERNDITFDEEAHPCWKDVPRAANEISSVLADMSPALDDQILCGRLAARVDLGKFKASIGSSDALGGEHLIDDDSATQPLTGNDMSQSDLDEADDQILDKMHESVTQGEIDLQTRQWSAPLMLQNPKEEWIQLICLRSGRLIQRQLNAHSRLHHRTRSRPTTPHCPGTVVQMIECCDANA
jgi:hypothetical protein